MPPIDPTAAVKAQHRRSASGSASPRSESGKSKAVPAPRPTSTTTVNTKKVDAKSERTVNVHYSLIIRLPFARGDFEEPPQVEWDANKDKKLWKIISKNSRSADIDWALHAQEFNVTQPFLLQQAAWLYERHFQHVKAQMNKLRTSNAPSPALGTVPGTGSQGPSSAQQSAIGGVAMKRLGSGGGSSRAPSSLSVRSRVDTSGGPGTPRTSAPVLSRTPSTTTVTQSRHFLPPASPRQAGGQRPLRTSGTASTAAQRTIDAAIPSAGDNQADSPPSASESESNSSTNSSEEDQAPVKRSQIFRRQSTRQTHKKTALENVADERESSDDESPTSLPFAAGKAEPTTIQQREDVSATLRDKNTSANPSQQRQHSRDATRPAQSINKGKGKQSTQAPVAGTRLESSASSSAASSSAANIKFTANQQNPSSMPQQQHKRIDALSPRHRAELARLSPRRQGTGATGRDGSDGTPSMGSSFSDLDDTSITQSALEEALASNFRHGGASRLSTISHAFGSRLYGRTGSGPGTGGGGGQG